MTIDYGVTPYGFNQKRLPEIKNDLENLFIQEFSEVNLDSQSVIGQIIGIFSKVYADIWEVQSQVYVSQYLASASATSLDNLVALIGITRIQAQRTIVIGVATGNENTFIPINSLARIASTNQTFFSSQNAFITSSNSVQNSALVTTATNQQYTVIISGISYVYSIPIITFSGNLIAGNIIQARINNINIPDVPFNTDNTTTLNDFLTAITNTLTAVSGATIGANSLTLNTALGFQVIVNSVIISGVGAPNATITFDTPILNDIAQYLSANINANSNLASSLWVSGASFQITALNTQNAYNLLVGTGLQIVSVSSPIIFLAQNIGVVPVPANSMTEILTPIAGWNLITNFDAGLTGRLIETDSELRLRALSSIRGLGLATVEAIRSRLLQDVMGVTSVTIFENVTLIQNDILVTFSIDFVALNNIQIFINSILIGTVIFSVDNLTTMSLIQGLIDAQVEVDTCTVQGVGNNELLIEMNPSYVVNINFDITSGMTQPNFIITGGREPKSFEAVVSGGLNADIAQSMWRSKPAGIKSFGNTTVITLDSQGNNQAISFTRATNKYIWVIATIVLNPQESFSGNGLQLVSDAILAYGETLGIAMDVLIQRVQSAVFSVQGIASVTIQLAETNSITDTPVYGSSNILIGETQISNFDLSRIIAGI